MLSGDKFRVVAIIIEKWRPDALKFLKAQESALAGKHVAFFIVCGLLSDDSDANRQLAQTHYIDSVLKTVPKITLVHNAGLFGGIKWKVFRGKLFFQALG